MEQPTLCLLGRPAVLEAGRLTTLALRPKALALLAYLALAGGAVVRRDLAGLLFPDAGDPLATLRWHLAHIRSHSPRIVADYLDVRREAARLSIPTDVAIFCAAAARVQQRPDVADAAAVFALFRDGFLAGVPVSGSAEFDNWLYVERERLQRDFRQAVVVFARWALSNNHAGDAAEPLSRLVSLDPYFEDAHVLLIETYETLDRPDQAAAAYDRYQRIVRDELAADPRPSVAARFETAPRSGRTLPQEHLVPLREVTIHLVDWPGDEPAIVAIHGSGGLGLGQAALAERLSPAHRVVALDLRGHGLSDKPPAGYYLLDHVSDVTQLIEALGLRRPVVMGHSAGGTIAAFVAGQVNVSGLILLEAMIGDRAFAENAAAQAAPLAEGLGQSIAGFDAYLENWRAQRKPFSAEAERLLDRWVRYALAPLPDGTYRRRALRSAVEAEWASIVAADSLRALRRVSCAILIVQAVQPWLGGRPYFTDEIVQAQLRAAPGAQLFVAARSNHAGLIRDPEPEMVDEILQFLQRCRVLWGAGISDTSSGMKRSSQPLN